MLSKLSPRTKYALIGGFVVWVAIYVFWLISTGKFKGWVG